MPIARVLCDQQRTVVKPMDAGLRRLHPFDVDALMKKLAFLVESATPRPYEQLTTLQSEFWSFTDVSGESAQEASPRPAAGDDPDHR